MVIVHGALVCPVNEGGCVHDVSLTPLSALVFPIRYKQRAHLMNPMVPGLTGEKMSSSEVDSKVRCGVGCLGFFPVSFFYRMSMLDIHRHSHD